MRKTKINTENFYQNTINFGKYNGKTIQQIIDYGNINYLEWLSLNSYDQDLKGALLKLPELTTYRKEKEENQKSELKKIETYTEGDVLFFQTVAKRNLKIIFFEFNDENSIEEYKDLLDNEEQKLPVNKKMDILNERMDRYNTIQIKGAKLSIADESIENLVLNFHFTNFKEKYYNVDYAIPENEDGGKLIKNKKLKILATAGKVKEVINKWGIKKYQEFNVIHWEVEKISKHQTADNNKY